MPEGLTSELCFAAGVTFVASFAVLVRALGTGPALALALLKAGLALLYFGVWDTGEWRLTDDVRYAEESAALLGNRGALGAVTGSGAVDELTRVAESQHYGYYVLNLGAMALFGEHYWAPVFVNVFLTCVAARALWSLMGRVGMGPSYRRWACAFFLVHWDVVAWSTLFNLKDSLVLCATVLLFLAATALVQGRGSPEGPSSGPRGSSRFRWVALFVLVSLVLTTVRWYVPYFVLGAFGLWFALHAKGLWRVAALGLGLVLLPAVFLTVGGDARVQVGGALGGAVRFFFTPRPWGIEPSYAFLLFPSLLHWLAFPLAVWGAVRLWQGYPLARPVLIYVLLLIGLYAVVPRVQGPRHRFQTTFALAWLQFHGAWALARQLLSRPRGSLGMDERHLDERHLEGGTP